MPSPADPAVHSPRATARLRDNAKASGEPRRMQALANRRSSAINVLASREMHSHHVRGEWSDLTGRSSQPADTAGSRQLRSGGTSATQPEKIGQQAVAQFAVGPPHGTAWSVPGGTPMPASGSRHGRRRHHPATRSDPRVARQSRGRRYHHKRPQQACLQQSQARGRRTQ
jgi:hypothetical protein